MDQLEVEALSYLSHLICRNDHYYYRVAVPVDLRPIFPTCEIKKSLKTTNPKTAKTLARAMEYKVQQTFALIRAGMLPSDQVQGLVSDMFPTKRKSTNKGRLLSVLMHEYVVMHETRWTPKTKIEIVACHRLIVDILGDVDVKSICKAVVLDFRSKLMRLPANQYKIYPGKTISEVLAIPDVTPMSVKSANKYISRLGSLLSYCVKGGILMVNFQGMLIPDKRRSDEERKAYTVEELKVILKGLPRDKEKPERYWIPVVAMYSGMRLDELCQMYVADVQQVDGVWCFSVNDDQDKKVKTLSSKRVIPIHPTLLRCGFLKYVDGLRTGEVPRLWMNLNWREADGYSNAFGKWFQKFNRSHVTTDKAKVFHSLRHTVTDTMKQAGIQEVVISEIMGHANDSMTMSRYGKRYQPRVLLEAMMHLDYGVEISPM